MWGRVVLGHAASRWSRSPPRQGHGVPSSLPSLEPGHPAALFLLKSPHLSSREPEGGEGSAGFWKGPALLALSQAKLPNLKEVDVRYTEAW